ncbi:hypothetical protein K503DRAFT_695866, partial [Rhizopogon vinicolor AM-OR11-026]
LPRRHASLLIQLRTGHGPRNKHLFRIKVIDTLPAAAVSCMWRKRGSRPSLHHVVPRNSDSARA